MVVIGPTASTAAAYLDDSSLSLLITPSKVAVHLKWSELRLAGCRLISLNSTLGPHQTTSHFSNSRTSTGRSWTWPSAVVLVHNCIAILRVIGKQYTYIKTRVPLYCVQVRGPKHPGSLLVVAGIYPRIWDDATLRRFQGTSNKLLALDILISEEPRAGRSGSFSSTPILVIQRRSVPTLVAKVTLAQFQRKLGAKMHPGIVAWSGKSS